jgi:hypothetical protein
MLTKQIRLMTEKNDGTGGYKNMLFRLQKL